MRAADSIDPGTDAGDVVNAGDRKLKAWRDALGFATELDQLLPRWPPPPTGSACHFADRYGRVPRRFTLPLVADIGEIHKRIAWASWLDSPEPKPLDPDSPAGVLSIEAMMASPTDQPVTPATRCGRWTRLWRAGAELRAHPDPAGLVLFGQAAPVAIVPIWDGFKRRHVLTRVDPEGPLESAPRRRLRDLFKRRTPDEPEPPAEVNLADTFLGTDEGDRP